MLAWTSWDQRAHERTPASPVSAPAHGPNAPPTPASSRFRSSGTSTGHRRHWLPAKGLAHSLASIPRPLPLHCLAALAGCDLSLAGRTSLSPLVHLEPRRRCLQRPAVGKV